MFWPSRMRTSCSTRATTATTNVTVCQARPSEDRVIPARVRLAGLAPGEPVGDSAGRAERRQLGRGPAADHLLGEQTPGGGTEGDAPHAVATRRVHAGERVAPMRGSPSVVHGRDPTHSSSRASRSAPWRNGRAAAAMAWTRRSSRRASGERNSIIPATRKRSPSGVHATRWAGR